jgi:hypothetical protein
LRLGEFIGRHHWERHRADDHILYGEPGEHQLRRKQHAELGSKGRDEHFHLAGDIHLKRRSRFHQREPDGDNDLHADGDQFRRFEDVHGHRDRHFKFSEQANDQFVHSQSYKHRFGFQQHAELGNLRRGEHRHYAGDIHLNIGKRLDQCETNDDDDLHADRDECRRLGHLNGKSYSNGVRSHPRHHHDFVPGRDTRRGLCRLHHRRERRRASLLLFGCRKGCLSIQQRATSTAR